MGMSDFCAAADDAESIAAIQAALDAGVTLLDTGDYYGMGHNELLLREALRGRSREQLVLSVKFGLMRAPGGSIVGNDLRRIEEAVPADAAAGERYHTEQMAALDSERR